MIVQAIVRFDDCRSASLGGYRMAPHRINLRDHSDAQFWIDFSNSDCSAQTCSTAPDDHNIVLIRLILGHYLILPSNQIFIEHEEHERTNLRVLRGSPKECTGRYNG